MKLKKIHARQVYDSRGKPTIEVVINSKYSGAAPSGTSRGKHEALEYPKKGIGFAVDFINLFKDFKGMQFEEFEDLAQVERLFPIVKANAMIALEFSLLKAMSEGRVWEFLNPHAHKIPLPLGNCVGGGAHGKGRKTDFQEFLLLPKTKSFTDAVFINDFIYRKVGKELAVKKITSEGAWSPNLDSFSVLDVLTRHKDYVFDSMGVKVDLGLDVAASNLWKNKKYVYSNFSKRECNKKLSTEEQVDFISDLIVGHNIRYVEDPLRDDDFESYSLFNKSNALICGDDLVCTNISRLKRVENNINAVIIKPNQIGSLLKTHEIVKYALKNDLTPVISHRSGETMDVTISHLAVAWEIPIIKCGICGRERRAKLDELKKIEGEI